MDPFRGRGCRGLRRHFVELEDELEADHQHFDRIGERLQQGTFKCHRLSHRRANQRGITFILLFFCFQLIFVSVFITFLNVLLLCTFILCCEMAEKHFQNGATWETLIRRMTQAVNLPFFVPFSLLYIASVYVYKKMFLVAV